MKKDFIYGISSDYFINRTCKLKEILSFLFNAFFVHGITNNTINSSIIMPLPKNSKKSVCVSNNYRAISLNTIICKLIEYILKSKMEDFINSSNYQFAYKIDLSTNLCTSMVTETINYYLNGNSTVYALFLDDFKAFDKVNHTILFNILMEKGIYLSNNVKINNKYV